MTRLKVRRLLLWEEQGEYCGSCGRNLARCAGDSMLLTLKLADFGIRLCHKCSLKASKELGEVK